MASEYEFGEEFQQKLLSLYLREPAKTVRIIEPGYFTNPIFVDVAKLARETYAQHDLKEIRVSKSTLYTIVRAFLGKKRRHLWKPFRRVVKQIYREDLSDKDVVLEQAIIFAKEQKFRQALVDAEKDVNNRQFNKAIGRFSILKSFGSDQDVGTPFWKNREDSSRWSEDREGTIGTFYLKQLDAYMGGGLANGELAIILAGGKIGKSTLLARIAAGAMWQKKNVAIATGELSAKKYRTRIDSMITRVPVYKLYQYAHANAESGGRKYRRKIRKILRKLSLAQRQMKGDLWIKQWPTNKGTIGDIEAWLDQLEQEGHKIDILFVDYVRVFKPNEKSSDMKTRIGQVAMDLRGLATERNIPVWTASQSNRAALHKEKIGPEDLAEDISIFWTLDFLIALCQTDEEKGDPDENRRTGKPENARLFLTAARDVGRSGVIPITIERSTFVIKEKEKFVENRGRRRKRKKRKHRK